MTVARLQIMTLNLGSLRLPSDLPPLEDVLSDAPALDARQVAPLAGAPLAGAQPPEPVRDSRLVALPSLQSNPTLSLSFSRFMATLDEDIRAMGAGAVARDHPAPGGEPPRSATPPGQGSACASPRPAGATPVETGRGAARSDTHRCPSPAVPVATVSQPPECTVNHLSAHALAIPPGDTASVLPRSLLPGGNASADRHDGRAVHDGRDAQRRHAMHTHAVSRDDTKQLELLLSEKSGSLPPRPPTPTATTSGQQRCAPQPVMPDLRQLCPARLADIPGPSAGATGGGLLRPGGYATGQSLPRWPSAEEHGPAWLSPRSVTTVSAARPPTPDTARRLPPEPSAQMPPPAERLPRRPSTDEVSMHAPAERSDGISQAEVHAWINDTYIMSGLTRALSCQDYQVRIPSHRPLLCEAVQSHSSHVHPPSQLPCMRVGLRCGWCCGASHRRLHACRAVLALVRTRSRHVQALLSLAGFPALAGLDADSRIPPAQFRSFRIHFTAALDLLRYMPDLWNRSDTCIISGFDMDSRTAESTLAGQPVGTFICRLCMQQAGSLIMSCKVRPADPHPFPPGRCCAVCGGAYGIAVLRRMERRLCTIDAGSMPVQWCRLEACRRERCESPGGCDAPTRPCDAPTRPCSGLQWRHVHADSGFTYARSHDVELLLQVDPSTSSADDSEVMHIAISSRDLHRADPTQLILSLPHASHVLDARTGFRIDKRVLLPGRQISITLAFGMLAVQAAVSDSSVGTRSGGARDTSPLKRPLEELAVQAADSAVRTAREEAAAAKRRRSMTVAAHRAGPSREVRSAPRPPQPPQAATAAATSGPMISRGSASEVTRWPARSNVSGSAM